MCTAMSVQLGAHYFGRTLDLDRSYGEEVVVMPRNFGQASHYAIIGMALVIQDVPLFYDGANERGLCMAGLNFPGNAVYHPAAPDKDNVPPYAFISWILGRCADLAEAKQALRKVNLLNVPLSEAVPLAPLHWIISDETGSVAVESRADGLHIHENPMGVMTNNPPFECHKMNLNNYRSLSPDTPENHLGLPMTVYCQGLGGLGLPGDLSSMSRFVRGVFHRQNARPTQNPVGQFFHLLGAVEMPLGSCRIGQDQWDYTVYTSCIEARTGKYYYTTYGNRQITCVDMGSQDLDAGALLRFPLVRQEQIAYQG